MSIQSRTSINKGQAKDNLDDYPFAFLATYSTKSAEKVLHMPLKNALSEFRHDSNLLLQLLSTVGNAADKSQLVSSLVESGELFSPLKFDTKQAHTFLKEIPLYEQSGISCRIPNWWKSKSSSPKMSFRIGESQPSVVGIDAILSFAPQLVLDGETLSVDEIRALLQESQGLAQIKGKWIEVDHAKLNQLLEKYQKACDMTAVTMADAIRMQLGIATV